MRNVGGICDDVASDKRRHLEWYGLSAQYDSFGTEMQRSVGFTQMERKKQHAACEKDIRRTITEKQTAH